MKSRRLLSGFVLALATGIAGALLGALPAGLDLEERFGLDWLFLLRGPRPAPTEVVVVSIDKVSAERFGLPNEPRKWPRGLHARLVDNLSRAGAAVVGFDINFEEPRDPFQDRRLEQAVRRAGNVVLLEFLRKETLPLAGVDGSGGGEAVIERLVPPWPALAQATAMTAPFPLPKVPVKVSQFWLFKGGAGDPATLPVAMYQLRALPVYAELRRVLLETIPEAATLPADATTILRERQLRMLMEQLRTLLQQPGAGERVRARLAADATLTSTTRQLLTELVHVYKDRDSRYLNYYGPPQSILTLPYHQVWQADGSRGAPQPDLRGKMVLVGFSEHRQPEQKDGFYTVYSQEASGLDISGVEIAATALANMLEDNPVRPIGAAAQFAMLLVWGMLIGMLALAGRVAWGVVAVAVAGLAYLAVAFQLFSAQALWLPLVVPLAIQLPAALFTATWWNYRDAARERNRIRQAFRHYLPERAVQALARDLSTAPGGELLQGVCLATDAARYTALAERLAPETLAAFMNRYYESLFQPVRAHGGFVSDVVGDAMLAVWAQVKPDAAQRARACHAALEVARAAEGFRESGGTPGFDTRLGLHSGPILLGNIGTADHLEYRAVGDIVNTAARLQALNKNLGTHVLASGETVDGLGELLVRPLGSFRLQGKTRSTAVVEILGYARDAGADQRALVSEFALALGELQAHRFDAALARFESILESHPQDGPARFYAALCGRFRVQLPASWDGIVAMTDNPQASVQER
jgi:adenylate cyclase